MRQSEAGRSKTVPAKYVRPAFAPWRAPRFSVQLAPSDSEVMLTGAKRSKGPHCAWS